MTYAGDIPNTAIESYVRDPAFGAILYAQWVPRIFSTSSYAELRRLSLYAREGDILFFTADTANGVTWQLRFSADGSTYPWRYVGGPSLYSEVTTAETTATTSYTALATAGPSVTTPAAGDYDVAVGSRAYVNTNAGFCYHSYDVGSTGAVDGDAVVVNESAGSNTSPRNCSRLRRRTGLSVSTALVSKYKTNIGTASWEHRWMSVTPIRVG